MFLQNVENGHLVEVLGLQDLFDPFKKAIPGRYNIGEDLPDPEMFDKDRLIFPSGEALPKCWTDPDYRKH